MHITFCDILSKIRQFGCTAFFYRRHRSQLIRFCCGAAHVEFGPISCQEIGRLPGNGSVNRSTDLMAKLLRHLGLGGKKSPSPQSRQEYSAQGIQSKAPGTDRCSGIVDESGRFDSLREDTRRHSECSTRTLPLSFESAATRERDWSLRGPNSKDLPVISSPADEPSPARINLPGQEGVCPTPAVAAEFVAGEESVQISSTNEVQVCFHYFKYVSVAWTTFMELQIMC